MKIVMIHRWCIILLLALLSQPVLAQNHKNSRRNENYMPTKEGTPGYYDDKVRHLFKQGLWGTGKTLLDEGLSKYETVSALNELMGAYWLHYKKYDKARYFLIRSLRDDNKNPQTLQMLMKVEEMTQHYSSAIVYCNNLLELTPYEYTLWRKKIELFRLQGNNVEATRMLKRLGEIYPEREEVRRELAGEYETRYRKFRASKNLAGQEEMLRELIKVAPKEAEFQMALCNLLIKSGRMEAALDVAGHAATVVTYPYPFVEKRASILGDMSRYGEAIMYVRNAQVSIPALAPSRSKLSNLKSNLEREQARIAAQNDPYTAYGRLYEREHSEEALTYLLNTSMSRGYLDDALMYIREARRRRGDTQNLMYREYIVQRRLGNTRAATAMLEKIHSLWPDNEDANEELCAIRMEEVRHMMDLQQWGEAATVLEQLSNYKVDNETKDAIARRLFTCYVNAGYRQKALQQLDKISNSQEMTAELYEEVMMPYIKLLMSKGMMHKAQEEIQKVLDKGHPSADILNMAITTELVLKNTEKARELVEKGKKLYPDDPYFMLKDAQLTAAEGNYAEAYDMLHSMIDTYIGDTAVVKAYAECCEELATRYAKASGYEAALRLIDEGLEYYPSSQSLILAKSMVYEKMREWEKAIEAYDLYHPTFDEIHDYYLRMESLKRHLLKNQVMIDYQRARPSSEDNITSMATVAYSRILKNNTYTLSMVYVGRDGLTESTNSTEAEGGNGIQMIGEWEHKWDERFTTNILAGVATKFLPRIKLGLGGSYAFDNDWTAKGDLSYRLIGEGYKTSLIGAGVGVSKELEPFSLGADVRIFYMTGKDTEFLSNKLFVNGGVIAKCYPIESNSSHFYVTGSVGNAPELSLIDNSMPVKFNQLNTMLCCGGLWVINSMLDFGISGTWYNMAVSTKSDLKASNSKNYLYLDAYVTIHF